MTTYSNNGGFGNMFEQDTVMTNKGTKSWPPTQPVVLKKCAKCDNTVKNEEVCSQCFQLTEDAKPILLD